MSATRPERGNGAAAALIRVEGLSKTYHRRLANGTRQPVVALDGVNLELARGTTMALVGSSGGGKSTLARCLALLEEFDAGEIVIDWHPVSGCSPEQRARLRPWIQLMFQDPAAALNPRFTAVEAVAEPLRIQRQGSRQSQHQRARELMREVGLADELAGRSTRQLSGGQRQRLTLARALAANPQVLILDEGLAALDLSLRAQITNLLLDLQARHGLTYLLISHDLRVVAHLADEIAVLDGGRIVEQAPPHLLLADPQHAATQNLVRHLPGRLRTPSSPGDSETAG